MRLINADALIAKWEDDAEKMEDPIAVMFTFAAINDAKHDQTVLQWIPCSKRLPEKPGKYLVTVRNGNVYAGTFDVISGKFQCAATAWMPLPEPYKGEQ